MNKKIIISLLWLSIMGIANANEKTGELKSSATMQATCNISTNNISFGVVSTPLMQQTASNDMNVLCSNSSAYTIDLAYGGVYGQGSSLSGYNIGYRASGTDFNQYYIFNSAGQNLGVMTCGYGTLKGSIFLSVDVAGLYSMTYTPGMQPDTKGICSSNNRQNGTYPTGWVGAFNATGKQVAGGISYDYGVMNGVSKGDKLAYSIALPSDANKVWNAGNNSYSATGTGVNQTIQMIAKIVPDKSGSKYPAPDMYLDTVTAVISY